eukprot:COSAG06_NODE_23960_length_675_cov_1.237435_1_plen_84_part_00
MPRPPKGGRRLVRRLGLGTGAKVVTIFAYQMTANAVTDFAVTVNADGEWVAPRGQAPASLTHFRRRRTCSDPPRLPKKAFSQF